MNRIREKHTCTAMKISLYEEMELVVTLYTVTNFRVKFLKEQFTPQKCNAVLIYPPSWHCKTFVEHKKIYIFWKVFFVHTI